MAAVRRGVFRQRERRQSREGGQTRIDRGRLVLCSGVGPLTGGLAVLIAARVGAPAGPRETPVSGTVKDLVVGIEFSDHGERELKRELRGVPGTWKLFAVKG
jgi:class 3 adenylate cyclase